MRPSQLAFTSAGETRADPADRGKKSLFMTSLDFFVVSGVGGWWSGDGDACSHPDSPSHTHDSTTSPPCRAMPARILRNCPAAINVGRACGCRTYCSCRRSPFAWHPILRGAALDCCLRPLHASILHRHPPLSPTGPDQEQSASSRQWLHAYVLHDRRT